MGGNSGKKARPKKMPGPLKSPLADEQKQPVKEVAKTLTVPTEEQNKRRTELLNKMNDILKANDGLESNIPMNSDYWELLKEFRSLEPQQV